MEQILKLLKRRSDGKRNNGRSRIGNCDGMAEESGNENDEIRLSAFCSFVGVLLGFSQPEKATCWPTTRIRGQM